MHNFELGRLLFLQENEVGTKKEGKNYNRLKQDKAAVMTWKSNTFSMYQSTQSRVEAKGQELSGIRTPYERTSSLI